MHGQPSGGRDLGRRRRREPTRAADDPVVGAHEARDERRLRAVVQILRRAQLLEAAVVHDAHVIGEHQCLGLIVRDVDEGGAESRLQLLEFDLHVLAQLQIERAQAARRAAAAWVRAPGCARWPRAGAGRRTARRRACAPAPPKPTRSSMASTALVAFRRGHAAPCQAERDVLADRHHREQRQLLKHHVHRPAVRRDAAHAVCRRWRCRRCPVR